MSHWYERFPDRYNAELNAYNELGVLFTEDSRLKDESGIIRLSLKIDANNPNYNYEPKRDLALVVVYPDNYPWFRPQVFAMDEEFVRHQNPQSKNLCLLPRPTKFWNPEQPLAYLLQTQLPLLFKKGVINDYKIVKEDESEQAEPRAEYFLAHSSILFDPEKLKFLEFEEDYKVLGKMSVGLPDEADQQSRMCVMSIRDNNGKTIYETSSEMCRMFPHRVAGILIQLRETPPVLYGTQFYAWLEKLPGMRQIISEPIIRKKFGHIKFNRVFGLAFPDEVVKGEIGRSWIFLVTCDCSPRDKDRKIIAGKKMQPACHFSKPAYLSTDSKKDRVPKLQPLAKKKVAIVGLGALGSSIALELARSGIGKLNLLDFDRVDPPTTVRWPLGLSAAGEYKMDAVEAFIRQNYPQTKVFYDRDYRKLGDVRVESSMYNPSCPLPEQEIIEQLLEDADILIDASAETGVNNYLFYTCFEKNIPYINLYATPGAWGGVVMRYVPGETGCWSCMKQWQKDDEENLVPPVDSNGEIQPPGCGDITFTGAGFDLQPISLAAVRLAVSTLCRGEEGGYPDCKWDWGVLRLVDTQGNPIAPQWTTQTLDVHPQCPYHECH